MSKRPLESLKTIASEYANLLMLGETDREKVKSLREKLGFSNSSYEVEPFIERTYSGLMSNDIQRVGIWKCELINGEKYFIKDNSLAHEFQFWADTQKIPPKGEKFRIAFLGESVARGYLFSPYFTPAKYLQALLDDNTEMQKFEVIDLARTSIHINELAELCKSSMVLDPDVIVIFAGNNWKYSLYPLSDEETQKVIAVSEKNDRFEQIKRILEDKYFRMIDNFMDSIKVISNKCNIPVVFVIPEFNLKDWKSIVDDRILFWPNGETEKWLKLKEELEKALQLKDFKNVERISNELIKVNLANPLAFELLSECKIEQGLVEEARHWLESARDTSIFRRVFPPVCISLIREVILNKAPQYGFKVVDLPQAFKEHLMGGIPGNDLFIDYCHLNVEGIQIAMKYLAKCLLSIQKGDDITIGDIRNSNMLPDSKVIADAHFLAAIHCAHICDQPYDMIYYHCLKAVQYSKDIMHNFIDMATRKVPWVYNKKCEYFCKMELVTQYPILFQPDDCKIMDIDLVGAMVSVMTNEGIDIKKDIDALRIKYFKPYKDKVNLLETYYRETSYIYSRKTSGYFAFGDKCYISSISMRSTFYLIADRENDILIELTFRSPLPESKKKDLYIKVNGVVVSSKPAFNNWQDLSIKVSKELLNQDGVNLIDIDWPLIDSVEKDIHMENATRYRGDDLVVRNSRLIYGDIFRLNAQICSL